MRQCPYSNNAKTVAVCLFVLSGRVAAAVPTSPLRCTDTEGVCDVELMQPRCYGGPVVCWVRANCTKLHTRSSAYPGVRGWLAIPCTG